MKKLAILLISLVAFFLSNCVTNCVGFVLIIIHDYMLIKNCNFKGNNNIYAYYVNVFFQCTDFFIDKTIGVDIMNYIFNSRLVIVKDVQIVVENSISPNKQIYFKVDTLIIFVQNNIIVFQINGIALNSSITDKCTIEFRTSVNGASVVFIIEYESEGKYHVVIDNDEHEEFQMFSKVLTTQETIDKLLNWLAYA